MQKIPFDATAYQKRVKKRAPKSQTLQFCLRAFWVGGLICCFGQAISDLLSRWFHLPEDALSAATAIILVFAGGFLTAMGVYDQIGAYAGAGSVVPITGFANSIVAPAIEYRPEGLVMGVAAKLFSIAGPVLVYGIGASILAGLLTLLFGG